MTGNAVGEYLNYALNPLKKLYGYIPYEIKLGKNFYDTYNFLLKSQDWSLQKKEDFQMRELHRILRHCYEHVPYYRRIFDERGIKPASIQCFEDLKKIPYLTKDIIRDNIDDLIALNYKKSKRRYKTTGGTTNIPMGLYDEKNYSDSREWAFVAFLWRAVGYDIRKFNRSVILRGNVPLKGCKEYRGLNLILSSQRMSEENMDEYIKRIKSFDPDYIQAYPSSIWILSNYVKRNGISVNLKKLKAIICTSEVLYEFQRKIISDVFNVRVYSFYGHTERSCIAGECEYSTDYHILSEYGYTELIGADNKEEPAGEIVCTGFNNYIMPFIRYRTGDIGVRSFNKCSCGRNYKLLKEVRGRKQEYFIDKSGNPVTFISHDETMWPVKDKITAYRYVQDEAGKIRIDIESKTGLSCRDIEEVKKEFYRIYPTLAIEVQPVKSIERTVSGKYRFLVQNVKSAASF